jgi:acyl-CoA-binding protein
MPSLSDSFQRIVSEQASFEDRMTFWRGAVELRRAHREHSSDLLMKAMIDSKADLSRSIVLLGTKSFIEKNSHDIPLKLRDLFSPRLDPNDRVTKGLVFNGTAIVGTLRLNAVKQLKGSKQRDDNRSELLSLVNSLAHRACFSKSHHGHRLHKKLQRVEDDARCSSDSKPRIKQIVERYSKLS